MGFSKLLYFNDISLGGKDSLIKLGDLGGFPNQMLLRVDKGESWLGRTLNWLWSYGSSVVGSNRRYLDFMKMVNGEVSSIHLEDYLPYMKGVISELEGLDIPVEVKHFDFIGGIRNVLLGVYMSNDDDYRVMSIDEYGSNDYFREKERLLRNWVSSEIEVEIRKKLLDMGIEPDSEEGVERFEVMKPKEIGQYLDRDWVSNISLWGNYCLGNDKERFYLDELDRYNLSDYIVGGLVLRELKIWYDRYEPIYWGVEGSFYDESCENGYIENGRYVGRLLKLSGGDVVSKLGHLLNSKQKERILLSSSDVDKGSDGSMFIEGIGDYGFGNLWGTKEDAQGRLYHYGDVELDYEGKFKIGSDKGVLSYGGKYDYMECYWKSYKQIGYLRYYDESGGEHNEIVTEELLKEYIREKGIKQLREVSFRELIDGKVKSGNILVWDWAEESWQGVRVVGNGLEIYYGEPCEFQLMSDNDYSVKLPVCGKLGVSYLNRVMSHQLNYNFYLNRAESMSRKEMVFLMFDIGFVPDSLRLGDTEETLLRINNIAKELGIMPIDSSVRNTGGGNSFNQFSVQNLSFGSAVMESIQIANTYKQMAYEALGLTPQMLGGGSVKQEGVKVSQDTSFNQTELLFKEFGDFKRRYLDMHLAVAQYCQKNDKDISVLYTKSDGTKAYLKFADEHFPLRRLGVMPVNNSKEKKRLETIRQYVLNTNTLGADIGDIYNIVYSDTGREILDYYEYAMRKKDEKEQQAQQQQQQMMERQYQLEEEKEQKKWERNEVSKERDRETKIKVEEIESYGRAVDAKATEEGLNFIDAQAKEALADSQLQLRREEMERKYSNNDKKLAQDFNLKLKEYELKLLQLKDREAERRSKEFIAKVNKN